MLFNLLPKPGEDISAPLQYKLTTALAQSTTGQVSKILQVLRTPLELDH